MSDIQDRSMFPLRAPVVQGKELTVDYYLKNPKATQAYVLALLEKDNLADYLYRSTETQGGSVTYQLNKGGNPFLEDSVGVVSPGAEFPVVHGVGGEPRVLAVKKIGGKFGITDEAAERNRLDEVTQNGRQLANTMRRELDRQAVGAINAAFDKIDGTIKIESAGWEAATKQAKNQASAVTGVGQVFADLTLAVEKIQEDYRNYTPDTLLVNPKTSRLLTLLFGPGNVDAALRDLGLTVKRSLMVTEGEAIVAQSKQVGLMGVEKALSTERWRENDTQTEWTAMWATVGFAVTDPMAMAKITNLNT